MHDAFCIEKIKESGLVAQESMKGGGTHAKCTIPNLGGISAILIIMFVSLLSVKLAIDKTM